MEAEIFIRRRGEQNRELKVGTEKFSRCRRAQSIPIRQAMARAHRPGLVTLAPRHPGFYIILAPQLKVSRSPRAGRPEGQSLYLWKSFPRILIQTCCFSASYESVRVSAYRNNVKRKVGWATIPHYSNSLLWQFSTVTVPPVALCQVTRSPEHVCEVG